MPTPRSRGRRRGLRVLAAAAALTLAACGSNIDPSTVAGTWAGSGSSGPGAAVGLDPGAGQVAGMSETADGGSTVPGTVGGGGAVSGVSGGTGAGGATTAPGGSTGGGGPSTGSTTGPAGPTGGSKGSGSAGGSGGGQASGKPGSSGGSGPQSAGGPTVGSCEGFKNSTGITNSTITLANVSDIGGPVPGIFQAAQEATRAYVEYFNSTSDICGRKLSVNLYDSRADAGADQQGSTKACSDTFAVVGSMSAFDAGGAATSAACGLPEIRAASTSNERRACSTCFSTFVLVPNHGPSVVPKFLTKEHPRATKGAFLYINAGAVPEISKTLYSVYDQNGIDMVLLQSMGVAESNYTPYVQQMKKEGVTFVSYLGPDANAAKLKQTMRQQGFSPEVYIQDGTAYSANFVKTAGEVGDGTMLFMANELFTADVAEMKLYLGWLNQVKPGAVPTVYGLYAWSATRLFVEQATALGGKLNRQSLLTSLRGVKGWTGNGLHAPMDIGAKVGGGCQKVIRLQGGVWRQISPGSYMCGPQTAAK